MTCIHNDRENLEECNMTCMPGTDLANGQHAFKRYTCGSSTNYEWLPINKFPECVSKSSITMHVIVKALKLLTFHKNNTLCNYL